MDANQPSTGRASYDRFPPQSVIRQAVGISSNLLELETGACS